MDGKNRNETLKSGCAERVWYKKIYHMPDL
jgi:hypothetical protein